MAVCLPRAVVLLGLVSFFGQDGVELGLVWRILSFGEKGPATGVLVESCEIDHQGQCAGYMLLQAEISHDLLDAVVLWFWVASYVPIAFGASNPS